MHYERGTFIYRLAGRDREKSASYYTPEVLTQCLVKYALKELLQDKTADQILSLTVCEPAMGSAAFLNEAVNQLARAYLDRKQQETGQTLAHEDYPRELQKVKMFLAGQQRPRRGPQPHRGGTGRGLPVAEHHLRGRLVPWFGTQLVCGNSLIGARRQVFATSLLKAKTRRHPVALDAVPERVLPGEERPEHTVYHFLLPDKGMAAYADKVVKRPGRATARPPSRPGAGRSANRSPRRKPPSWSGCPRPWTGCGSATSPCSATSTAAPPTRSPFGQAQAESATRATTTEAKDRIYQQEILAREVRQSSPFRRLAGDGLLVRLVVLAHRTGRPAPGRAEFLLDLTLILEGNLYEIDQADPGGQLVHLPGHPAAAAVHGDGGRVRLCAYL